MPDASPVPEPFIPVTGAAALADLRARLRSTRWPDAPQDAGWSFGTDLAYLRDLVAYWADGFDWQAQEAALARLPRFRVRLGGLGIHFVHVRAVAPAGPVLPLVLTHGWPDSFWRYAKVISLLTDPGPHGADPADAFDVVVPDVPGFGFSDRPAGPPLDSVAVAGLWAELMGVLGYERFGAAGGDIGSHVSRYLALDHPDRVVAVHRTDAGLPVYGGDPADLTPEERAWIESVAAWGATEGAYAAIQRTKPQTAAFGLNDSPAGLAAWIVEKLRSWSDCGGDIERSFTKDDILTNVTIYWLTGTIGSSMRMYRANAAIPPAQLVRRVEVPSGFSLFAGDVVRPPRAWLERTANVVRVTEPPRGGHFAAFEEPELYAGELRAFFRPYRRLRRVKLLGAVSRPGAWMLVSLAMAMAPRHRADRFLDPADDPRQGEPRQGEPGLGDERATLVEYLRYQRMTLEVKCGGLDAEQLARRSVEPSTMSLLGLVRHMAHVERVWFRIRFAGNDVPLLYQTEADPDGDFDGAVADLAVVEDAFAAWREEIAFADGFIRDHDLDFAGVDGEGEPASLRELLVHMIEEYARHNGHADLLRERIDGRIGQ